MNFGPITNIEWYGNCSLSTILYIYSENWVYFHYICFLSNFCIWYEFYWSFSQEIQNSFKFFKKKYLNINYTTISFLNILKSKQHAKSRSIRRLLLSYKFEKMLISVVSYASKLIFAFFGISFHDSTKATSSSFYICLYNHVHLTITKPLNPSIIK